LFDLHGQPTRNADGRRASLKSKLSTILKSFVSLLLGGGGFCLFLS
jgi:hypothetical protein